MFDCVWGFACCFEGCVDPKVQMPCGWLIAFGSIYEKCGGDQPKSPKTGPGLPMRLFYLRERFWPMAGGRPWSSGVNKNLRKLKKTVCGKNICFQFLRPVRTPHVCVFLFLFDKCVFKATIICS